MARPDDRDALGEPIPAGTRWGRYVIARRIGAGGTASVYEARHADLDKRVAIKMLHKRFATQVTAHERFLREARAASRLRHPHVVDVSDVGVHDGVPYIVMEYLEGEDLASLCEREGRLPPARVVAIAIPIASAVAAAHTAGIVHRDLKPENVFLARTAYSPEHPVLVDFGISKLIDAPASSSLTASHQVLGTPFYMSPEQVRAGAKVDARTDQYSLGVIMYECLAGVRPFTSDKSVFTLMAEILTGSYVPLRERVPALDAGLAAVIARAMAADPEARYATVLDLARALLPHADALTQAAWGPRLAPPAPRAPGAKSTPSGPRSRRERKYSATREAVRPSDAATRAAPTADAALVPPQRLRVVPALAESTDAELEALVRAAAARRYDAGAVLYREGEAGESCFMILEGEVDVSVAGPDGRRTPTPLGPGAVVGQIALVERAARGSTAAARSAVLALELTRASFEQLVASQSALALRVQEGICVAAIRQLRAATTRLGAILDERATARSRGARPTRGATTQALARVRAAVVEWDVSLDIAQDRRVD